MALFGSCSSVLCHRLLVLFQLQTFRPFLVFILSPFLILIDNAESRYEVIIFIRSYRHQSTLTNLLQPRFNIPSTLDAQAQRLKQRQQLPAISVLGAKGLPPRTSSPTSTSAATLTHFYRSRRERCYHRNKENTYTFWGTNARYCAAWEYAELLIEFGSWRGGSGDNDNFQSQYQRAFQWQRVLYVCLCASCLFR